MLDAVKKQAISILLITVITLGFFTNLFFPEPSIFTTPGYGKSDSTHFNYPIKDFLSKSLKAGNLPFWSPQIGTGFPVFAEGQAGSLYLPNLILFFLLPTWLAFNLNYLLHFFLLALGSYLFTYKNLRNKTASFFAAVTFSFSGYFIVHLPNHNHIQAASLLPWILLTAQNLWEKPTKTRALLFALILSQQIFSGYPQITFLSLLSASIILITNSWFKKSKSLQKKAVILMLTTLVAIAFSAPQILPTAEMTIVSGRFAGLNPETIFKFPYPPKHLITFLFPNFFGTPKNGTYPSFNADWGLFWENTAYVGIIPILLALLALAKRNKKPWEKAVIILGTISLLLTLGKYSPIFPILLFPGFSNFRVPSRFLLPLALAITLLAAQGLTHLMFYMKKHTRSQILLKITTAAILIASFTDLFSFAKEYNPTTPVKTIENQPTLTKNLPSTARILTHPNHLLAWNNIFLTKGWIDPNPYIHFLEGLDANQNLLYNLSNANLYAGMLPFRQGLFQQALQNDSLINASAITHIISAQQLESNGALILEQKTSPQNQNLPVYYRYANQKSLPRVRFASSYEVVSSPREAAQKLQKENLDLNNSAILETDPRLKLEKLQTNNLEITKQTDTQLSITTTNDQQALLIIADSYYPGWETTINGKPAKIFPANINQRALIVPAGTNTIEMKYVPYTFYAGLIISFTSIAIIIFKWSAFKQAKTLRKKNPNV